MAEATNNRGGRPPKADKMSNHQLYVFMPSEEAVQLVRQAAEEVGLPVSAWARSILLREARHALEAREVRGYPFGRP